MSVMNVVQEKTACGESDFKDGEMCEKTIRYDTRCYFNVRSKADMSQLNLQHGNDN